MRQEALCFIKSAKVTLIWLQMTQSPFYFHVHYDGMLASQGIHGFLPLASLNACVAVCGMCLS